jgi:hypothetical protein
MLVSSNSCSGVRACSYNSGSLEIGQFSCTEEDSCYHSSGNVTIDRWD